MIALKPFSGDPSVPPRFDIGLDESGDLLSDEGLETAIIISLFCDARAREDDDLPEGADPRGWCLDALAEEEDDEFGSRLWLLERAKTTPEVLRDAKTYVEEALEWMLDDGVAASITVDVQRTGTYRMDITVSIQRPEGGRFQKTWDHQLQAA